MKQFLNQLGTIGIVTVVTLLVWLYAEDANIVEYTNQPVRLEFEAPAGENGRMSPAGTITVQIDFDGSNGQFQQFAARTREKVIRVPLPLTLTEDYETAQINLRQLLEDHREFRDLGINIKDVRPAVQAVSYERFVEVPLGVPRVEARGVDLAEPATINSPQPVPVNVKNLPASRRAELEGVEVVVVIRPEDVAGLPRGVTRPLRLPVRLTKEVEGLTLSPATVDVLVKLANNTDRVKIDRRAIQLSYPPSINERYIIEIDASSSPFITAFELEGPRDQIALIKQDPTTSLVKATVWLTNDEVDKAAADGGELSKAVDIIAPPGVVPVSVAERVTIRVRPRAVPPPTP